MKHLVILAVAALLSSLATLAEDGSRLWLRHDNTASSTPTVSVAGVKRTEPTVAIAVAEIEKSGIGIPVTIRMKKSKAHPDAYSLKGDGKSILIEAASPAGLLYGAFALSRAAALGRDIATIDEAESPAFDLRMLNHWDNLNGTVERGYAGNSIWKWDELPSVVSPRYDQYARACASVGINAAVLNNVNASPQMLTSDNLAKVKVIADRLRPYGITTFLSVNFASPKVIGGLATADPLDQEVRKWWSDKIDEIYTLIPDFGGFLVKANSEGEPGPGDYGRSHSQGANMLADALARHDGTVLWRAFVYNPTSPDRAMQAYEEFMPLDGEFRDNVIIQIKNGPVDFQPREPFSPLFGAMRSTRQAIEFQITQEYLGASNHLVFLAPLFKETLDSDTHRGAGTVAAVTSARGTGKSAIAGVANIGDDTNWCGHDFAQANWYAFGRLAWDPSLNPADIAGEWLGLTFTTDPAFVRKATDLMMDSREAAVDYMMPLGLHHIFAGGHHYGPEPWYYVEGMRPDWTPPYYHKATADSIGFDRTAATGSGAIAQYAAPVADRFADKATCPDNMLLWFQRMGWDEIVPGTGTTVWHTLCDRYSRGVDKARQMQIVWDRLQPLVDAERFAAVQDKLKIQTHDAQWWKDACLLYFQEINGRPFPDDMERPVYTLPYLKAVKLPYGLYGCPSRGELP